MAISVAAVCIVLLLGTLRLTDAAPVRPGDLKNLVKVAEYLYARLQEECEDLDMNDFSSGSNINCGTDTAVNGNNNFNFKADVHGLFVNGN